MAVEARKSSLVLITFFRSWVFLWSMSQGSVRHGIDWILLRQVCRSRVRRHQIQAAGGLAARDRPLHEDPRPPLHRRRRRREEQTRQSAGGGRQCAQLQVTSHSIIYPKLNFEPTRLDLAFLALWCCRKVIFQQVCFYHLHAWIIDDLYFRDNYFSPHLFL